MKKLFALILIVSLTLILSVAAFAGSDFLSVNENTPQEADNIPSEEDHVIVPGKNSTSGIWLDTPGEWVAVEFTTTGSFREVSIPRTWASREDAGRAAPVTLSLYKFEYNADATLELTNPVKTVKYSTVSDNVPQAVLTLDEPVPAGTYVFKVEIDGDMDNNSYLVLDEAADGADLTNVRYINTNKTFMFSIYGEVVEGSFTAENPADAAPTEVTNIDYVLLFNGASFVENLGKGSNLGQICRPVAAGGNQLYILGWYIPPFEIADFGYQIDDNDPVFSSFNVTFEQATADILTGWGYDGSTYRKFDGLVPVLEGQHTVRVLVRYTNGVTRAVYQTSYKNDDTDIALGKPVYVDLNGLRNAAGYWADEYINDGYNPVHAPAVVADPVPLGFYPVAVSDLRAKIYIDLEALYDLSQIDLHPQGFNNFTFPSAYDLYTSADGLNWELVAGVEGREGNVDSAEPFVYVTEKRARYILLDIKGGVVVDGLVYASIGEIEVYGNYAEASDDKAPYLPYKTYEGTANVADAGGKSAWTGYTSGTLTYSFIFNTDVSFYRIGFPAFWGSPATPVTIELIKGGETVFSTDYTVPGDGGFTLMLGETLAAGEYTCRFTINDSSANSDGVYNNYIVIGYADNGLLGSEYVATERGQIAFDIYSDEQGEGFIKREYRQHVNIDTVRLDDIDQGQADGLNVTVEENSQNILVHGWLAANYPIEKYGYRVDGGEAVYDDSFIGRDPGTAEAPNGDYVAIMKAAQGLFGIPGNGYRADVLVPVTAGTHTVEIVAMVGGEEKVFFTFTYGPKGAFVEVMSRDQVTVDGVDKASFGGNAEVTDIAGNLYELTGKQLRIWGWYGNNRALDKYGVKVDGGEMVYFDRYEAEDIVNHIRTNLIKDQDVYASRFEIFVDITEGRHTAEVFAIVDGEEHLIWTVNYDCMPEEIPKTGDSVVAIFGVVLVLAMCAAVVLAKKRS